MKRILFVFFLASGISFCSAQSFDKGTGVADAGAGLLYLYDEVSWKDSILIDKDTVGAFVFPVKYEYGILKWLGAGGMFRLTNYIEGDSSSTQVVGMDLSGRINVHALRTDRINLLAGVTFGYSYIRYTANDAVGTEGRGHGINFGVEGQARFYFSDHFGIFLNGGYLIRDFPGVLVSNSTTAAEFHYSEKGYNLGIGIMIRFE